MLWACANVGNPQGGPYDTRPPVLLETSPKNKATRVTSKKIELEFDEYVKLVNQSQKVIISPPQKKNPHFILDGKSIIIELEDSLKDNRTYSFYFDDAIVDNNEGNAIENFHYTFSTGDTIDSMQISGKLLDARTLEPVKDMLISAYYAESVTDSTLLKVEMPNLSKTNQMGEFTIRGLKDSTYFVFAIDDKDHNYMLAPSGEGLAFSLEHYKTTLLDSIKTDTIKIDTIIHRDTLHRDSLVTKNYIYYRPDDIILRYFSAKKEAKGLKTSSRLDSALIELEYLSPLDTIPSLTLLDTLVGKQSIRYSVSGNKLYCWLNDSKLIHRDSLRFSLDNFKFDSLGHPNHIIDTLAFFQAKKSSIKDKDKAEKPLIQFVQTKGIFKGTVRDSIYILASEPLDSLTTAQIKASVSVDKDRKEALPFSIEQDKLNTLRYNLNFEKKYGQKYSFSIDSAQVRSIYHKAVDSLKYDFSIAQENEFAQLEVEIVGLDSLVQVELLDNKGDVLWQRPAIKLLDSLKSKQDSTHKVNEKDPILQDLLHKQEALAKKNKTKQAIDTLALKKKSDLMQAKEHSMVLFTDLKPATYFLRLYLDRNNDGQWTTGAYPQQSPEEVYYCPLTFELKKGIKQQEKWLVFELPLDKQKPEALRKVKEVKKEKKVDKNIEYYKELARRMND